MARRQQFNFWIRDSVNENDKRVLRCAEDLRDRRMLAPIMVAFMQLACEMELHTMTREDALLTIKQLGNVWLERDAQDSALEQLAKSQQALADAIAKLGKMTVQTTATAAPRFSEPVDDSDIVFEVKAREFTDDDAATTTNNFLSSLGAL